MNDSLVEDLLEADFPRPSTSHDDYVNLTETMDNNGTLHHGEKKHNFNIDFIMHFMQENPWVYYVGAFFIFTVVVLIVVLIVRTILKNKKRVIRQDSDPILSKNFQDETKWCLRYCCCRSSSKDDQSQQFRQNSASNLDPYKRPNLPPLAQTKGTHYTVTPFTGQGLGETTSHRIQGIRGVPHQKVEPEQQRQLPPLRRNQQPPM